MLSNKQDVSFENSAYELLSLNRFPIYYLVEVLESAPLPPPLGWNKMK